MATSQSLPVNIKQISVLLGASTYIEKRFTLYLQQVFVLRKGKNKEKKKVGQHQEVDNEMFSAGFTQAFQDC